MKRLLAATCIAALALAPAAQASSIVYASVTEVKVMGSVLLVKVAAPADNKPACATSAFDYRVTERNQVRLVLDSVNNRPLVFKGNNNCAGGSELLQYIGTVPPA